ncbi:hypothetical protein ETB97_006939 [Aspergillus alliaceus]|uniref:NADH dehydrogenase [ubiquinone] 1 alpha subcomplex subunit 1 n=1 Tax=Petromyces alliaceus TaxID=209559 RepID=A0A8H6E9N2_PETAA|nr:hypothetical protein ETB97_006939 [Aspergillus burnettii]
METIPHRPGGQKPQVEKNQTRISAADTLSEGLSSIQSTQLRPLAPSPAHLDIGGFPRPQETTTIPLGLFGVSILIPLGVFQLSNSPLLQSHSMGVPFEALIPYGIIVGMFGVTGVGLTAVKWLSNDGKKARWNRDLWDRYVTYPAIGD